LSLLEKQPCLSRDDFDAGFAGREIALLAGDELPLGGARRQIRSMGRYWYRRCVAKCEELSRSAWPVTRVVLLVGIVLPLFWFTVRWQRVPQPTPLSCAARAAGPFPHVGAPAYPRQASLLGRHVLPYSVIPGGVSSAEELTNALLHDPLVADHYAEFDAAKARRIRLDRDRAVYVSYRLGHHIYWTSRKLTLLKGETVLTDGEHEARTRCGNRISNIPQQPVSLEEPAESVLENPALPLLPENIPEWSYPIGDLFPLVGGIAAPAGGFLFPPVLPIGGGGSSPGTPKAPPPAATPEPPTLIFLASGLLGMWLRLKQFAAKAKK
jgi:hypothetical protein